MTAIHLATVGAATKLATKAGAAGKNGKAVDSAIGLANVLIPNYCRVEQPGSSSGS